MSGSASVARRGRHAVVGDEHRDAARLGADEAGGHLVEADLAGRREELLVLVEEAGKQVDRVASEDVDQLLALPVEQLRWTKTPAS
jgi:hypothetical protein